MKLIDDIDDVVEQVGRFLDDRLPWSFPVELLLLVVVLPWMIFKMILISCGYQGGDEE